MLVGVCRDELLFSIGLTRSPPTSPWERRGTCKHGSELGLLRVRRARGRCRTPPLTASAGRFVCSWNWVSIVAAPPVASVSAVRVGLPGTWMVGQVRL